MGLQTWENVASTVDGLDAQFQMYVRCGIGCTALET